MSHAAQINICLRTYGSRNWEQLLMTPPKRNIPCPPDLKITIWTKFFDLKENYAHAGPGGPSA